MSKKILIVSIREILIVFTLTEADAEELWFRKLVTRSVTIYSAGGIPPEGMTKGKARLRSWLAAIRSRLSRLAEALKV